jgi:hypothetical protein
MDVEQHGGINNTIIKFKNKIELIDQGTYGCVFKPALTCKGEIEKETGKSTESFITKVQKRKDVSDREIEISNKIKKIKNYHKYFAPILKTCTISVAKISTDEINKCDFMKSNKELISNKLRYVGKYTLDEYLIHILRTKPSIYIEKIYDTFFYLMKSINILFTNKLVHFDIKDNNIMYDEKQDVPIIIDYGLTFDIDMVNNKIRDVYYVDGYDYKPWCIEIAIISYIMNSNKNMNEPVDILFIKHDIEKFLDNNSLYRADKYDIFTTSEVDKYKQSLLTYLSTYLSQYKSIHKSPASYKELIKELEKSMSSWDIYALAVAYIQIMYETEVTGIMQRFTSLLKDVILAMPNERSKICKKLETVVNHMERKEIDYKNINFDKIKHLHTKVVADEKKEAKKYKSPENRNKYINPQIIY